MTGKTVRAGDPLALCFFAPLVFYLLTMAPGITEGDSPELAGVSHYLGIAHMGYPFFALLGKAGSLLPFGTIAFRVILVSAIVLSGMLCLLAWYVRRRFREASWMIPGIVSLGFLPFLWREALTVEVYGIHLFLTVLFLLLLCDRDAEGVPSFRRRLLALFLFGLSCGMHVMTVLWLAPLLVMVLVDQSRQRGNSGTGSVSLFSHSVWFSLAAIAGLAIFAYVPIRAIHGTPWNWNAPDSVRGVVALLSGESFRRTVVFSQADVVVLDRLWGYAAGIAADLGLVLVVLGLAGLIIAIGSSYRGTVMALISLMLGELFYCLFLNQAPLDVTPFGLVTKLCLSLCSVIALFSVARYLTMPKRRLHIVLNGLFISLVASVTLSEFPDINRQSDHLAEHFTTDVSTCLGGGRILICEKDEMFTLLYAQSVEHNFPDVVLLHYLQLDNPPLWVVRMLFRQYPDFMKATGAFTFTPEIGKGPPFESNTGDKVLDVIVRMVWERQQSVWMTFPDLLFLPSPIPVNQHGLLTVIDSPGKIDDPCSGWNLLHLPSAHGTMNPLREKYCTMMRVAADRARREGQYLCADSLYERMIGPCSE